MKKLLLTFVTFLLTASWGITQGQTASSCVSCHQEQDPPLSTPVDQIKGSVHERPQLGCVGCHGGDAAEEDPEISMSPKNGFVGKPRAFDVPELCAKCHSNATFMRNYNPNISVDQYDRYLTSQHGLLLAKGDAKVATCTSCHGVHDIKRAHDPTSLVFSTNIADLCGKCHANADYMKEYAIETNQVDDYKTSVHAQMLYDKGDLSAPTCNDCHGNHGAMPPGITSIANVCGTCHYIQSEYFTSSPHKSAFDDMGLAECEACHGNHAITATSDTMLGTTEPAACINCHDEDSKGFETAALMRAQIDSVSRQIAKAETMLNNAHRAGVRIPSEKSLYITNAKDALTHARTLVHTFSLEKLRESTSKGLQAANEATSVGVQALEEVSHRRKMLVLMVVLTLLVAVCLILFIRNRNKTLAAQEH